MKHGDEEMPHIDGADGVFVPINDEFALVMGAALEGLTVHPIQELSSVDVGDLASRVTELFPAANAVGQTVLGQMSQGLVRLDPKTLHLLRGGATLASKDGAKLGAVFKNGRIVHQARLTQVGGLAASAPMIGMALAMAAVQHELKQISRLVQENLELTRELMQRTEDRHRYLTFSHIELVHEELARSRAHGAILAESWSNLQHQASETALKAEYRTLAESLGRRLAALQEVNSLKGRREWHKRNLRELVTECHTMIAAHQAWMVYQLLHASSITGTSVQQVEFQKELIDKANAERRALRPLVDATYRALRMSCGARGTRIDRLPWLDRVSTVSQLANTAADRIADLEPEVRSADERLSADAAWIGKWSQDAKISARSRVRWLLDVGEDVDSITRGGRWGNLDACWIVLTERRVIVVDEDSFQAYGRVHRVCALIDIIDIRSERNSGTVGGPDIVIQTERGDIKLQLPRGDTTRRMATRRLRARHAKQAAAMRTLEGGATRG